MDRIALDRSLTTLVESKARWAELPISRSNRTAQGPARRFIDFAADPKVSRLPGLFAWALSA
jgi:hypothetical protein